MCFIRQPQDQTFRTSEIFFGFRRDTTDDIAYPTQGSQQSLHYELAPAFLGSGYQYTSVRLEDAIISIYGRKKLFWQPGPRSG